MAKAAISATAGTDITGDIGVSPAASTYLTGFVETLDASGTFATSTLVQGEIGAANLIEPTPALLTLANGVSVLLAGGALPENVFGQVAGQATLGTTSVLHGIVLSKTTVVMATGAVVTGRAYAQTEITFDAGSVTQASSRSKERTTLRVVARGEGTDRRCPPPFFGPVGLNAS